MPQAATHREPRWHAMVALIAVGGLRLALPHNLSVGPDWLLLAIVGVLVAFYALARYLKNDALCAVLGYLLVSIVTVDMTWSLVLLVQALPSHRETSLD